MRRTPIHLMLIAAATAAALTGCSKLPTAPTTRAGLAPGSEPDLLTRVDGSSPPGQGGNDGVNTATFPLGKEGTLRAGRFTLFLKAGSLTMPTTISMVQPNLNVMQVQILVSPAAANNFKEPVKLVADCSFQAKPVVTGQTMFWWAGAWQQAADSGPVSNDGRTITAETHRLSNAMVTQQQKPAKHDHHKKHPHKE